VRCCPRSVPQSRSTLPNRFARGLRRPREARLAPRARASRRPWRSRPADRLRARARSRGRPLVAQNHRQFTGNGSQPTCRLSFRSALLAARRVGQDVARSAGTPANDERRQPVCDAGTDRRPPSTRGSRLRPSNVHSGKRPKVLTKMAPAGAVQQPSGITAHFKGTYRSEPN
jgi:hypothetical protein